MNNSSRNVVKLTFTIVMCFFFLFLTPMHAQQNPKPELKVEPKPELKLEPKLNSTSPETGPNPESKSNSTLPKAELKPEPKLNSTPPKTEPKSHSASPKTGPGPGPEPEPKANSPSPKTGTKPEPKSNSTSTKTEPKQEPKSNSTSMKTEPKSEPKSNSTSTKIEPKPEPKSKSESPKTGPEPEPKSNSASPKTGSKPQPKSSTSSSKPKPKSNSAPKNPEPTPPKTKPAATSPYHFTNHFCLSRRLDVKSTFCLHVLRSSPTSAIVKDNLGLLEISADLGIQFGNKTILFLKKLLKDKKTVPNLKPVIEECLSAYEGYITQFKLLVQEAKTEAQLASYDSELAKLEINRCVKALGETKNPDIHAQNKIALDYTKLSQNIADSID